jgi:hypothetical protein
MHENDFRESVLRKKYFRRENFHERPRQSSAEGVIHLAEGTIARLHQIQRGQS